MKKFFSTLIAILILVATSFAQTKVYRTDHINIGFGKSSDCATNQHLDFCVNGPLVNANGLPVGGYTDTANQEQPWTDPSQGGGNFAVDNAIFGMGMDGKFYTVPHADINVLPKMKWAFQNGPILVKDGINVRGSSTSKFARSGVGYTNTGTLVVIITFDAVTFREFADMFVKENCISAIYLDGGPYVGYSDDSGKYGTMVATATKLQFYNN